MRGAGAIVDAATYRRVCRAIDLVRARYDEPLSVDDLAAAAGLSPYHFLRTFRRVVGATPHRYLTDVRLERAKELLARGDSVTEVCGLVGFHSVGSFSSLFRRQLGCAPSEFRRQRRRFIQVPADLPRLYVPSCFFRAYGGLGAQF